MEISSMTLGAPTASLSRITQAVLQLYDRLVDKELQVRRMSIAAIRLSRKEEVVPQLSFYTDQQNDGRETALIEATIGLHRRYGKNAVVKGMDLLEAATTMERNGQIGGHRKLRAHPMALSSTLRVVVPCIPV